jgi:hypothetical protein
MALYVMSRLAALELRQRELVDLIAGFASIASMQKPTSVGLSSPILVKRLTMSGVGDIASMLSLCVLIARLNVGSRLLLRWQGHAVKAHVHVQG